jgi:hypothetical protein
VADGVRLMPGDLARHGPAVRGQRVTSPISSTGMPGALSAAIFCARSRASLAAWAPAGWRSAARRRSLGARAGGPSGDGWRTRRPPECRAGPGHRRARSDRNHRCRDRPGSTHPPRAPRWHCSRPTRSAGPRRRRPPDAAPVQHVRRLRPARAATTAGSGPGTGRRPSQAHSRVDERLLGAAQRAGG